MVATIERRGGNPLTVCRAYGISQDYFRAVIARGEIRSYCVGNRRTVILFSDVEAWIRTMPQPKAWRRRHANTETPQ